MTPDPFMLLSATLGLIAIYLAIRCARLKRLLYEAEYETLVARGERDDLIFKNKLRSGKLSAAGKKGSAARIAKAKTFAAKDA